VGRDLIGPCIDLISAKWHDVGFRCANHPFRRRIDSEDDD
jgi:hypothetical protein